MVKNLKYKIENEIKEIDKLYEKVEKEITEYYKRKHEELIKNEGDIKDNLQNEVTKAKEKLQEYLSFSNKIIKDIEIINKGIKTFEKEEKNILKILTYASKINKNEKEMKQLNYTKMRNIKICFEEKENKIKYKEYFFNGIPSPKDIEFKDIDSNKISLILGESERYDEFIKKIYEWTGYNNMELLYRGTRDGMETNYFHNKCNNQGPTISLFKNDKGYIFGGYASTDWTSYGDYKSAPDSFIFTLTNVHRTEPTKFPNSNKDKSIYDHSSYGPTFGNGHDIKILINDSYANFPNSYQDILGKGKSIFTGDLNNTNMNFNIKEIEVFKMSHASEKKPPK